MPLATLIEEGPKCSKCGMKMVRCYENWESCQTQRPWCWWCGCGHTEEGGIEQYKTEAQSARDEWNMLNNIDQKEDE